MKRFPFLLLALSVTFVSGCRTPAPDDNTTKNQGIAVNANLSVQAFDNDDKAVAVIIHEKPDGTGKEIIVSEPKVKVKRDKVKLRFHVFNNLDTEIGNVEMKFDVTDPFNGPPPFETGGTIKAGDDKKSQSRKAKNISPGLYKYTIRVFDAGGNPIPGLPPLDPEVEISN
ncbi:MAG: hypothetical protein WCD76_00760 [Pyrinomonadaceae bacterium]